MSRIFGKFHRPPQPEENGSSGKGRRHHAEEKDVTRHLLTLTLALAVCGSALAGTYGVVKRSDSVSLDGAVEETVWANVPAISGAFQYPWENAEPPSTTFKAFHDDSNFYFSFVCADPQVLAKTDFAGERVTVDVEDRVELFFSPSPIDKAVDYALPTYYAVEVDALGRVHDYSMVFYRAAMDSAWNMPGLKTAGKRTAGGYSVEGVVPIASLRELNLLGGKDGNVILTGAFRAEFSGDTEKPDAIEQRWISWIDPETDVPDFHVESAFGKFVLLP